MMRMGVIAAGYSIFLIPNLLILVILGILLLDKKTRKFLFSYGPDFFIASIIVPFLAWVVMMIIFEHGNRFLMSWLNRFMWEPLQRFLIYFFYSGLVKRNIIYLSQF